LLSGVVVLSPKKARREEKNSQDTAAEELICAPGKRKADRDGIAVAGAADSTARDEGKVKKSTANPVDAPNTGGMSGVLRLIEEQGKEAAVGRNQTMEVARMQIESQKEIQLAQAELARADRVHQRDLAIQQQKSTQALMQQQQEITRMMLEDSPHRSVAHEKAEAFDLQTKQVSTLNKLITVIQIAFSVLSFQFHFKGEANNL